VSTEYEIRDRSHRLDEAAQGPEGLRSAHLRTGSPCKVDEGRRSQRKIDTRRDEDSRTLPAGEVAPSLLGGHVLHAIPVWGLARSPYDSASPAIA